MASYFCLTATARSRCITATAGILSLSLPISYVYNIIFMIFIYGIGTSTIWDGIRLSTVSQGSSSASKLVTEIIWTKTNLRYEVVSKPNSSVYEKTWCISTLRSLHGTTSAITTSYLLLTESTTGFIACFGTHYLQQTKMRPQVL